MSDFLPLSFETLNVGKRVKRSKKKIAWKFRIGQKLHCVELYISRVSGKIRIYLDGSIHSTYNKDSQCFYSLNIDNRNIVVCRKKSFEFDLKLGRVSFSKSLQDFKNNPFYSYSGCLTERNYQDSEVYMIVNNH